MSSTLLNGATLTIRKFCKSQISISIGNNINMKKLRAGSHGRKTFLKAIFSHSRKLFSKSQHKFFLIILRYIIGFENFLLCFSQS